jgi:hypothetical protein
VIAAAQAAASWARARRATWTDVPLPRPVTPATEIPSSESFFAVPEPAPIDEAVVVSSLRQQTAAAPPAPPPRQADQRTPANPWILRGAIAAGVMIPVAIGGFYAFRAWSDRPRSPAAAASPVAPTVQAKPGKGVGGLKVTSTPEGARVVIDGRDRGITPLSLDDLPVGAHAVSIESKTGSVQRSVMVSADYVAQLDEEIFDGWVAVFSPIEVVISEGGRVLRPDDHSEIMLPPGTHQLRFTNRALGFEQTIPIVIKPGEKIAYTVAPARSSISVTSNEAAEVFLDGTKIGDTPVSAAEASIGTHNLTVRRTTGAEKRMPITVTVKPFTIAVTF